MDFISFILSIRASEGNTPDSCVGSREITLTQAKPSLTIGRDPDKDVVLINNHVSRKHAEIRWDGRKLLLFDRHSRAWTFVGGNKLDPDQPYEVKPGDSFRIEPYVLTVTFGRVTGDIAGSVAASSDDQSTSAETDMTAIPIHPVIAPECTSSSYLRYLPDIFHESDFLGRYLRIFESIWEPLEQRQAHIHCYFDPRTCPSALLPWLAEWFGWPLNQAAIILP